MRSGGGRLCPATARPATGAPASGWYQSFANCSPPDPVRLKELMMKPAASDQPTVERDRPAQWNQRVRGGQFMDRILPAPIYDKLETDTWGANTARPRDVHNGIEHPNWSYWGGIPVRGDDGRYHFLGCRWPQRHPKGHMGWPQSVMIRAIGDRPTGPFAFENEIGPGHFPEITQLPDGRWALFHFEGYYLADRLDRPWTHVTPEQAGFADTQMKSVVVRENGSLLMIDHRASGLSRTVHRSSSASAKIASFPRTCPAIMKTRSSGERRCSITCSQ